MSLLPRLLGRDFWDVYDYPEHVFDQNFGLGLLDCPDLALISQSPRIRLSYPSLAQQLCLDRRHGSNRRHGGMSSVKNNNEGFQVQLDVSHFSPKELDVKVVDDSIVIHGKHEEKSDEHGFISREFSRRYLLPKDIEPEKIKSSLGPDGVLRVEAPKKIVEQLESGNERVVPITMTETPAAVQMANNISKTSTDQDGKMES